jgi:hypothetical protein
MAKPRAKRGDVFSIPIDDRRVGYGQVVLKNHSSFPIYIVVFGTAYDRNQEVSLNEIVADGIALVGASMDARIYHGMWKIIGNIEPDRSRIPRPNFKVYIGGSDFVENSTETGCVRQRQRTFVTTTTDGRAPPWGSSPPSRLSMASGSGSLISTSSPSNTP